VGVFAALFLTIGAVAVTGSGVASVVYAVLGFVVGAVLGLLAWGLLRTISIDVASELLDRELEHAVAASGANMCGCGHEHDPDELHVTDACAHDGAGAACSHDCATCVLAGLRAN
jgi:NhaP-type Na+/H+ or K+/H+ antiporter